MRQLFAPDLFSRSQPGFERVDDDMFAIISSVIGAHYGSLGRDVTSVERLAGLEINSKNFRVAIGPRRYALKRAVKGGDISSFAEQCEISQRLLERGVLFPRIVRNDGGGLLSYTDEGSVWVLTEFVDGNYFSGARQHFFAVARAVGALQITLESTGPGKLPLSAAAATWPQTSEILSELLERARDWPALFPPSECEALARERQALTDSFLSVATRTPSLCRSIVPTHIDIHPHNILVTAGNFPVFVDVDSLQLADRTQSLAFAAYKLARQHVVAEGGAGSPRDMAEVTSDFVDELAQATKLEKTAVADFRVTATSEILRRIAIIADLNMHKGNRDWNAVLHMHLAALHEIPLLFANVSS